MCIVLLLMIQQICKKNRMNLKIDNEFFWKCEVNVHLDRDCSDSLRPFPLPSIIRLLLIARVWFIYIFGSLWFDAIYFEKRKKTLSILDTFVISPLLFFSKCHLIQITFSVDFNATTIHINLRYQGFLKLRFQDITISFN